MMNKKSQYLQYMYFKRADFLFAVETDRILDVKEDATILQVPQMPDYLLGFVNLQRDRAAIIDINIFWSQSHLKLSNNPFLIIMDTDSAYETGLFYGIIADRFLGDSDLTLLPMQHHALKNDLKNSTLDLRDNKKTQHVTGIDFEKLLTRKEQEKIWACSEWFGLASQSTFLWTKEKCKFSANYSH